MLGSGRHSSSAAIALRLEKSDIYEKRTSFRKFCWHACVCALLRSVLQRCVREGLSMAPSNKGLTASGDDGEIVTPMGTAAKFFAETTGGNNSSKADTSRDYERHLVCSHVHTR